MKKLLPFLLLLFACLKTFPATFIVTSNADSGPGTLRDALTQAAANGSAMQDSIHFNLADTSVNGRTITILSQLPYVSSNLVIDGTSQPGNSFGVSNAKVIITVNNLVYIAPPENYISAAALILNGSTNVAIYGLYINNFHDIRSYYQISAAVLCAAIILTNVTNVTIGAPGKGNVICNDDYGLIGNTDSAYIIKNKNIFIQSNFIGISPDGKSIPAVNYLSQTGIFMYLNNALFGGDGNNEGNYFGYLYSASIIRGDSIQMVKNRFGVDYYGNSIPGANSYQFSGSNLTISNNVSTSMQLNMNGETNLKVYGNIDKYASSSAGTSVFLESCQNGVIGSDSISQINVFYVRI